MKEWKVLHVDMKYVCIRRFLWFYMNQSKSMFGSGRMFSHIFMIFCREQNPHADFYDYCLRWIHTSADKTNRFDRETKMQAYVIKTRNILIGRGISGINGFTILKNTHCTQSAEWKSCFWLSSHSSCTQYSACMAWVSNGW